MFSTSGEGINLVDPVKIGESCQFASPLFVSSQMLTLLYQYEVLFRRLSLLTFRCYHHCDDESSSLAYQWTNKLGAMTLMATKNCIRKSVMAICMPYSLMVCKGGSGSRNKLESIPRIDRMIQQNHSYQLRKGPFRFSSSITTMSSDQDIRKSSDTDVENVLSLLELSEKSNVPSFRLPVLSKNALSLRIPEIPNNFGFILWTVINTLTTIGIVQFSTTAMTFC